MDEEKRYNLGVLFLHHVFLAENNKSQLSNNK